MLKKYLSLLFFIYFSNIVSAQKHEIQIGVQTGLAIPQGDYGRGLGSAIDNGYATVGQNYKIYLEYRVKGVFFVGINYVYFSNSQDEGNLRVWYNNQYSTYQTTIIEKSGSQGILGSLVLKGTETPLFIKGFLGLGYSKSGSEKMQNTLESNTLLQSTSDLGIISGLGIGFNIPIKNKWFLELEADYISSAAKPKNIIYKDNNSSYYENWGDINYNQTVINLNIGVGIFLFRE